MMFLPDRSLASVESRRHFSDHHATQSEPEPIMGAVALVLYLEPSSRSETGQLCRRATIDNEDTSVAFASRDTALKHTPKTNEEIGRAHV